MTTWGDFGQLLVTTFGEPAVILICALCIAVAALLAVMAWREITEPIHTTIDREAELHVGRKVHTSNSQTTAQPPTTRRVRAGSPPPPLKPSYDGRQRDTNTPRS